MIQLILMFVILPIMTSLAESLQTMWAPNKVENSIHGFQLSPYPYHLACDPLSRSLPLWFFLLRMLKWLVFCCFWNMADSFPMLFQPYFQTPLPAFPLPGHPACQSHTLESVDLGQVLALLTTRCRTLERWLKFWRFLPPIHRANT